MQPDYKVSISSMLEMLKFVDGLTARVKNGEITAFAYVAAGEENIEAAYSPLDENEYEMVMQGVEKLKEMLESDEEPEERHSLQ